MVDMHGFLDWAYPEGSDDEVADFQVTFPHSDGNQLLEFQESGLNIEDGGDGSNTNFGGLGHVQNDGHNGSKEFIPVSVSQRRQGIDDMRAKSAGNDSALDVRDETLNGGWDFGVAKSQEGNHLLGVRFGIFEGFESNTAVFVKSISFAWAVLVGRAGDSDQVTVSHSDSGSHFLGLDFGVFFQEFFIRGQQFFRWQTQVERHVSNSTASFEIMEFTLKNHFFEHDSSRVATAQRQNLNEEISHFFVSFHRFEDVLQAV